MQPKATPLSTMSKGSAGGRAVSIDLDAEFDAEFGDEGPRGGNGGGLVETSMPVWLQPNSVGKDSIGAPAVATHTQEDEWGFGGGTAVSNLFGGGIRAPIKGRRAAVDELKCVLILPSARCAGRQRSRRGQSTRPRRGGALVVYEVAIVGEAEIGRR